MSLATTSANSTAIGLKHPKFQPTGAFSLLRSECCLVKYVIGFTLFFMSMIVSAGVCSVLFSSFVGHKNAASFQLAALTRQAGKRQLEVSIA